MKRRILSFILVIATILSMYVLPNSTVYAEDNIYVSMGTPAIPMTKDIPVSIDKIVVEFTFSYKSNGVTLKVDESNKDGIKIENNTLIASKAGVYKLSAEKGNFKRNIYAVVRENAESEHLLFSDDFNAALSADYRIIGGNSESVYTEGGFLYVKGPSAGAIRVMLPAYLAEFGNYEIEVVATLTNPLEATRWNSVVFRSQQGDAQYLQMAVRSGATAANGVEIAENTGSWIIHQKGAYKENIDPNKLYTYKALAEDDNITVYINNEEMLTAKIEGYFNGGIGFQADRSIMKIDSVKVKYVKGSPSKSVLQFTEIAQPETDIIGGIGFSEIAENEAQLNEIVFADVTPSNVIFYVNKNLQVTDKTFNNPYMNLGDAINSLMGIIMPTVYVKDADSANALAAYIKDNKIDDIFVMSDNPELVLSMRKTAKNSRGVIDFTVKYADRDSISEEELLEIRGIVNTNYATIAVIPSNIASVKNVKYLYDRLIAVWVQNTGTLDSKAKAYSLLVTGAHGIVSDNTELLVDVATNVMKGTKLLRTPLNIGHRGVPSLAPENTIEGGLLAYENGADVIEIDVYLTKDKVPVIIHDGNTARTCNGVNLDVQNSTLEQLKELNANEGRSGFELCRIPTLEEFYEAIKDLDVQVFLEIKTEQKDIVPIIKEITEKYNMTGRISTIMFSATNIKRVKDNFPVMSAGYLLGPQANGATSDLQVKSVLKVIQPYGSTYNPSYNYHSPAFFTSANMRGVTTWPWTINDYDLIKYFLAGANGLTTNTCQVLAPFTKTLASKKSEYIVKPGVAIEIEALRTTYKREEINATKDVRIIILEGEDNVTVDKNTLKIGKNTGTVIYALEYTHAVNEIDTYKIYSEPVTITVTLEPPAEANNYLVVILVVSAAILLAGIFVVLLVLKRGKAK